MKLRLLFLTLLLVCGLHAQVSITTAQVDNTRGSYNALETILTPTNLTSFNLTGVYSVDGAVIAQQLKAQITIGGNSRSCLLIATMAGTLYCGDAKVPGLILWKTHVSDPQTSFVQGMSGFLYLKPVGCLSTPTINLTKRRIYAVCADPSRNWILYTLNLDSGTILSSSLLTAQVPGIGCVGTNPADTVSGGNVVFFPSYELQRAPLTLNGNILSIAFTSWDDVPNSPWHGWNLTEDVSTDNPAQLHVWNSTPNGCGGGIWESGGGTASDSNFYYFATGNGDYDGVTNFGMSVVKLDANLNVVDWWTPQNYAALNDSDSDLSSGRVMIIPGTQYITFGSKDWLVRLIDTTNMGHLTSPLQEFLTNPSPPVPDGDHGIYGGALANGIGYFPNKPGFLYAFNFNSGVYNTTPVKTVNSYNSIQGITISSNAGANGLLWIVTTASSAYATLTLGVLRALDPITLEEKWNSSSLLGHVSKFSSPTVVDGRLYIGNEDNQVLMFSNELPSIQGGLSVTILSWTQN